MNYDLEDRTKNFSKNVLRLISKIKINELNRNILSQLSRSATSVGANYQEANGASSKNDFRNKIFIAKKEIKETEYWIEMLAEVNSEIKEALRPIWKEAHELVLIFNTISTSLKIKN